MRRTMPRVNDAKKAQEKNRSVSPPSLSEAWAVWRAQSVYIEAWDIPRSQLTDIVYWYPDSVCILKARAITWKHLGLYPSLQEDSMSEGEYWEPQHAIDYYKDIKVPTFEAIERIKEKHSIT